MSKNRGLICAVAIGMLAAGVACTVSGETNAPVQRPHEGKGFAGHFMAGLEQLNLTADQSQQIESIMKLSKESMQAAATQAKDAREALNHQTQVGPFDEQSVRAACKKAAAAEEEVDVLRAKVTGQVRAVLTSDQQAAFDKMRADMQNSMHKRFAKERGATDK